MSIQKKIVTCQKCKYFTTKADQLSSRAIKITQANICYRCQACLFENVFDKNDNLVSLPENAFIKLNKNQILRNQSSMMKKMKYFAIFQRISYDDIAYWIPKNISSLKQKSKIDGSLIENIQTLEQKSSWLKQYRKRKKAISKFIKIGKQNEKVIMKDEYEIYLLHRYLQKACLNGQFNQSQVIQINIVLKTKELFYYFTIEDINLSKSNKQLSQFLLISALSSVNLTNSPILTHFSPILQQHQSNAFDLQNFEEYTLLLFNINHNESILKIQRPDEQLFTQIDQYITWEIDSFQFDSKYEQQIYFIDPFHPDSFIKNHIQKKQAKIQKENDSVTVFWKQRRSPSIQISTLTQNIATIKQILMDDNKKTDTFQSQLKNEIMQFSNTTKSSKAVYPFKINATLTQKQQTHIILFTFNWSSIHHQKIYQSLEEPLTYNLVFQQDILQTHQQKQQPSPFLKKRRTPVVFNAKSSSEDEQNMISL